MGGGGRHLRPLRQRQRIAWWAFLRWPWFGSLFGHYITSEAVSSPVFGNLLPGWNPLRFRLGRHQQQAFLLQNRQPQRVQMGEEHWIMVYNRHLKSRGLLMWTHSPWPLGLVGPSATGLQRQVRRAQCRQSSSSIGNAWNLFPRLLMR